MTKKEFLRSAVLIIILLLLILPLCHFFSYERDYMSERYTAYHNLPKDTVDVVIVGTSGIDRYWIAAKGYAEYGITAYPLSYDHMSAWLVTNQIRDALENQNPKLMVIDMRPFTASYSENIADYESSAHSLLDMLDFFSSNRLDGVRKTVDVISRKVEDFSPLSFYLPFIKYHTMWKEPEYSIESMNREPSETLGFFLEEGRSTREVPIKTTERTDELVPLDPVCEEALYEVLDYLDTQDFEVLFLHTPKYMTEAEYGRDNTIRAILDERGYKYKRYDSEDGTYNLQLDFYNDTHTNIRGAEKFTDQFASYLKENYDLPDRRLDEACAADWNGVYDRILAQRAVLDEMEAHENMRPEITVKAVEGGNQIDWTYSGNAMGYIVYRCDDMGKPFTDIYVEWDGSKRSYVDTTAEPGKPYYYAVRAFTKLSTGYKYGRFSYEAKAE